MSEPIWSGWRLQQDGSWWGRWTVIVDGFVHRATVTAAARTSWPARCWEQREGRRALDRYLQSGAVTLAPREDWAEHHAA